MNKVELIARMVRTPELQTTASGIDYCNFTVAVNRRFKNAEGNYEADFINCVAWRNQADFICKYFNKGDMVGLVGSIQTRTYDKDDGTKAYVTEVVVEEVHFCGSKTSNSSEATQNASAPEMPNMDNFEGFAAMPNVGDDLPF